MSGKDSKKLKKFLKERGLSRAWKKYQKIPRKRRDKLVIDGEKVPVVIYKRKDRTVVAHGFDLRTIATTKKYNTKNVRKALETKKVRTFKRKGVKFVEEVPLLKLRFIKREEYRNFELEHGDYVRKKRQGKILLNVTFTKGKKGTSGYAEKTVEADSGREFPLFSPSHKSRAFNQAFRRCVSQINFSPDDYNINFRRYLYARRTKVVRS